MTKSDKFYLTETDELVYVRHWSNDDYVVVWIDGSVKGVNDNYIHKLPPNQKPVTEIDIEVKLGENYRKHYVEYKGKRIFLEEILNTPLKPYGCIIETVSRVYGFESFIDLESRNARFSQEEYNIIQANYDWINENIQEDEYMIVRKICQGSQTGYRVFFRKVEYMDLFRLCCG